MKIASAVGLRSRFLEQRNSRCFMLVCWRSLYMVLRWRSAYFDQSLTICDQNGNLRQERAEPSQHSPSTHGLPCKAYGMICLRRCISQAGSDILSLNVGVILYDFFLRHLRRQQIQHILHPDPHPADTGASSALFGIECNSFYHPHRLIPAWSSANG